VIHVILTLENNPSAEENAINEAETEYVEIYEEKVPLAGFPEPEPMTQLEMFGIAGLGILISAGIALVGYIITKQVAIRRFGPFER